MPVSLFAVVAMVAGLLVACASPGAYTCAIEADCTSGGAAGFCEPDGRCSVADGDCPSGRRYGDSAGALAGACVGGGGDIDAGIDTPPPYVELCAPRGAVPATDACVAMVCQQRPSCCAVGWDEGCAQAAEVKCGRHCSGYLAAAIHAHAQVGSFDGVSYAPHDVFGNQYWVYDLEWGHIGGDDRADLAAARQPAGNDSGLVIRATIGLTSGVLATRDVPLTGDRVGAVDQVEWADIDGDGDLDVLVFGASGLFVAENEGASFAVHRLTSESTWGAVTLDVDGAPPLELLVAFNPTMALDDERLVLHRLAGVDDFTLDGGAQIGTEFPDNLTRCQIQPGRAHVVAGSGVYPPTTSGVGARVPLPNGGGPVGCGDVDGDGWDDLVVGDGGEPVEVYLSRGGFQSTAAFTSTASYITRHIELGDVDGDGRLDIIVNDAYAPDRAFGYLRNTTQGGTVSFEEAMIPDWDPNNTNQRFDLGPTPAAAP